VSITDTLRYIPLGTQRLTFDLTLDFRLQTLYFISPPAPCSPAYLFPHLQANDRIILQLPSSGIDNSAWIDRFISFDR
jgi:hypothetical protein